MNLLIIYEAAHIKTIDGDTAEFDLSITIEETILGRRMTTTRILHDVRVRFLGINTPERHMPGYEAATQFTDGRLRGGKITVQTDGSVDHFGRLLGTIFVNGTDLCQELLAQKLAVIYTH